MNKSVEKYFREGCGRCPLGGTPRCKVHNWASELELLRKIALNCGLQEESKWGAPCYTFNNKNILMISAFKEYCSMSFFKGTLLKDVKNLMVKPGPNSQATRLFKFKSISEILRNKKDITEYILESIEIEKDGKSVILKKDLEPIPLELESKFVEDPLFKNAFDALTSGRKRGYILYFSQAKQEKTRISRIEKCIPLILSGIGLNDKYK